MKSVSSLLEALWEAPGTLQAALEALWGPGRRGLLETAQRLRKPWKLSSFQYLTRKIYIRNSLVMKLVEFILEVSSECFEATSGRVRDVLELCQSVFGAS